MNQQMKEVKKCHELICFNSSPAPPTSGSLLCGWLRAPSALMCEDQDWDVTGQGSASRICGAGLTYNEQQRSFVFDFGGQKFTISKKIKHRMTQIRKHKLIYMFVCLIS